MLLISSLSAIKIQLFSNRADELDFVVITPGEYQVQLSELPATIKKLTEIRIRFPTGYSLASDRKCSPILISWTNDVSIPDPTLDCTTFSGNILTVKGGFPTADVTG